MSKHSKINLPKPQAENSEQKRQILPVDNAALIDKSLSFSFVCFDRTNKYFNLADIKDAWFLDLLDCFKSVCNKTIPELKNSKHDLHPIDWNTTKANAQPPRGFEFYEYWQFRLNKTRGRVIGFITNNVFYVVWLDPHHNFTDSDGYETARKKPAPKSEYDENLERIEQLETQLKACQGNLTAAEELLNEKSMI